MHLYILAISPFPNESSVDGIENIGMRIIASKIELKPPMPGRHIDT